MRARITIVVAAWVLALGMTAETEASPALRCRLDVARVRVGGRVAWCAQSMREEIVSPVVESARAGAVAFATRSAGEWMHLVVVLIGGELDLYTMTWDVPLAAQDRGPTVTWLGERRVGFGYSPLVPDLVASWTVRE